MPDRAAPLDEQPCCALDEPSVLGGPPPAGLGRDAADLRATLRDLATPTRTA